MYHRTEIRKNLLACLETALFMNIGPDRFSADLRAMKKSFLIPLMLLPMTLVMVLTAHPDGSVDNSTANVLIAVYSLRLVVYLAGFLTLVYFMAKSMNKMESFYKFATANNWLSLPAALLMLPLLAMFLNGHYAWSEVYPLMVVITLYSYAYTAFMAARVMNIPWELAGFVAIAGMAIHQTSLDVLKWMAVQTINLIA